MYRCGIVTNDVLLHLQVRRKPSNVVSLTSIRETARCRPWIAAMRRMGLRPAFWRFNLRTKQIALEATVLGT